MHKYMSYWRRKNWLLYTNDRQLKISLYLTINFRFVNFDILNRWPVLMLWMYVSIYTKICDLQLICEYYFSYWFSQGVQEYKNTDETSL